ncbi:hypothetical protein J1605_011984, partial [Eschrichtius robustus]
AGSPWEAGLRADARRAY